MVRIGIDLGGTKIEAIALDQSGRQIIRQRVSTPQGDYQATLSAIVQLIDTVEVQVAETGSIGIGTPGAISPSSQLLRNSNSVCMNGQPVKQDLEKMLGREIRISNDANCFALSEATDGAAKDAAVVLGVIIGTGTGAGVVVNGKVLTGPNAIAGEWGHNPLPWPLSGSLHGAGDNELPGPDCYCGKQGCIETFLSGPGLSYDYKLHGGEEKAAQEIITLAQSGDVIAAETLERYHHRLARSLAHVINILDPDVIVLGGGMSNIQSLYTEVPKLWGNYVFSDEVLTRLVPPVYGDSSGVRGAAWLWNG